MSIINRVLHDLDRAGGITPSTPATLGAQAVHPSGPGRTHPRVSWGLALLLLASLAGAGWWLAPAPPTPLASVSSPATAAAPVPAAAMAQPGVAAQTKPVWPAPIPTAPAPAEPAAAASPIQAEPPRPAPRPVASVDDRVVKEMPLPRDPLGEAWREAGLLLEQGRHRDARAQLARVLGLAPDHLAARQTLITLLIEAGERAEALSLLSEGRALHPSDPWHPRSQAQLHLQAGQPALAAGVLKPALSAASSPGDWALYAGIASKLDDPAEAARAWRAALRNQPDQGAWWIGLGVALDRQGLASEARQAYLNALQTRLSPELLSYAQDKVRPDR